MIDAKTFTALVRGTADLADVSYRALEEAADRFPYCRNAHDLLLMKGRQDERPNREALLERAASYSIDRPFLFERLRTFDDQLRAQAEALVLAEEEPDGTEPVRSFHPPRHHARDFAALLGGRPARPSTTAVEPDSPLPFSPPPRHALDFAALLEGLPVRPELVAPTPPALPLALPAAYAQALDQLAERRPSDPDPGAAEPPTTAPLPKKAFGSWRRWTARR